MSRFIYSCARAHIFRENESPEEAWKWVIDKFNSHTNNFTHGGSFEGSVKAAGTKYHPLAGDIYKWKRWAGSEIYVEIIKCQPEERLMYVEDYYGTTHGRCVPRPGPKSSPPDIMNIILQEHFEGTRVYIERVETSIKKKDTRPLIIQGLGWGIKKVFDIKDEGWDENTCVNRLAFILTGDWPNSDYYESKTYTIERDDSLKELVSEYNETSI